MYQLGQVVHGFRLLRREPVAELAAEALIFVHEATRAETVVVSCEDDNKVFMIAFRTPVDNDTGVPHILEHSVLNGSRKYPVKEPFLELVKGSLYTFLNAMTYPDKTVYPVASRNDQDFANLMDVYLDAVFHPLLSRHTFLQEGWHYELDRPDGELRYSGVVYNEMLGSYSDPETLLDDELEKTLFPQSPYGRSSGGDPQCIPQLSYEQFVAYHQRYYHPSNSRIYLYGKLDVAARLAHLQQYLSGFSFQAVDSAIRPQPRFTAPVRSTAVYPLGPGESAYRKSYALHAILLGPPTDPDYHLAMSILAHILCDNQASPLRKALIDSHLGDDCLSHGYNEDILDTYFAIGLKGTDAEAVPEMEAIIARTLHRLATEGIDPRTVEAAMNTIEFSLREANYGGYPKGLVFGLLMHDSWLYGGDPLAHLRFEAPLAAIKARVAAGGFFEGLIRQYLLDNPHRVTVTLMPDVEHEAATRARLAEQLAAARSRLGPAELERLVGECRELAAAQRRPDPPEALATLPKLPRSCLNPQAEPCPFTLLPDAAVTLSWSELPTQGIAYVRFAFSAAAVPPELLPWLPLYARALIQAGTRDRDYVALTQEIGIHTGGLGCSPAAGGRLGDPAAVHYALHCTGKALTSKLDRFFPIVTELLTRPDFTRRERLAEIVTIARSKAQTSIVPNGHHYVSQRLAAYTSPLGRVGELTGGLSQYEFLERTATLLSSDPARIEATLTRLHELIVSRAHLHVHVTGGAAELAAVQAHLPVLLAALPSQARPAAGGDLPVPVPGEGFIVPSKVQYVGKGINLHQLGVLYNGRFEVVKKLLSRDYLWNKVRVQGNAYGCFASHDVVSGQFACVSYRDPNLRATLATYDAFADYLADLRLPQEEFDKLLIGTLGGLDAPRPPDQQGAIAFSRYRTGITQAMVQQWRDELLASQPADLADYAELFRRFAREGQVCVLGGEEPLRAAADCFRSLTTVFAQAPAAAEAPDDDEDDDAAGEDDGEADDQG